jgi:MFS family permease
MYPTLREQLPGTAGSAATARRFGVPRVSRTVLLLGVTSFFTDVSSEMVAAVLPLYLVLFLGLTPLQFGIVDGLYHGVTAFVRLAGGYAGDRWRRHKEVAVAGYGLSAVCKLGLAAAGSAFGAVAGLVMVDRVGKGIRTAPRDALISLSTRTTELGTAFGVHRAMDTAGAMLGPLLAFTVLALIPNGFDVLFVLSFCFAIVGVTVLALFVEARPAGGDEPAPKQVSLRRAVGLLAERRFRGIVLAGGALSLATVSDGFAFLTVQDRLGLATGAFPLLYVITAAVYMVLAVPVGRLADRVGRGRVFVGGYVTLLGVYGLLLLPSLGPVHVLLFLVAFGVYYAATDGVLMALASSVVPAELRSSGLALLATVIAVGRLLASVLFGAVWTVLGAHSALVAFGIGLAAAMLFAAVVLSVLRNDARAVPAS